MASHPGRIGSISLGGYIIVFLFELILVSVLNGLVTFNDIDGPMKIWASGSLSGKDIWLIVGEWGTGIETLTRDRIALARATEVTAALGVWKPTRKAQLCWWHGETGELPPSSVQFCLPLVRCRRAFYLRFSLFVSCLFLHFPLCFPLFFGVRSFSCSVLISLIIFLFFLWRYAPTQSTAHLPRRPLIKIFMHYVRCLKYPHNRHRFQQCHTVARMHADL